MYFLPPDYEPNPPNLTLDSISQATYWNSERLQSARHYQHAVFKEANKFLRANLCNREKICVADLGCGAAQKTQVLRAGIGNSMQYIGFDQPECVEWLGANYPKGQWVPVNLLDSPEALRQSSSYRHRADLVICSDVVEHVSEPDMVFAWLKFLCKPGGWIIISTVDRSRVRRRGNRNPPNKSHVYEWTKSEFLKLLQSRGFRIEKHRHVLPAKFGANKTFLTELYQAVKKRRNIFYGQLAVIQLENS